MIRACPLPQKKPRRRCSARRARTLDEVVDRSVSVAKAIGGKGFPLDARPSRCGQRLTMNAASTPTASRGRWLPSPQRAIADPNLEKLEGIPTLVIHGSDDPLVPLAGGEDTHKAIKGSKLKVIEGMGHDLPEEAWPEIVEAISAHTSAAH